MEKKKRILPPSVLPICLILSFILHLLFPIKAIVTGYYRLFGAIFIVFGAVINLWADNLFKREKTTVKPNETPAKLITEGPFRFNRHPMYLGFVSLLLGIAIVLGSLSSFVAPILMFLILDRGFIPMEEKQMERFFGEKYLEYKGRVRRWL